MFYGIPAEKQPAFQQALQTIADTYRGQILAADMNISIARNLSFLRDRRFLDSFTSTAASEQEKSLVWRLHVLAWAGEHALHLEGDFVECGVFQGFSSAVLCKYLDFASQSRNYYLYDTFSGLPEETSTELERKNYEAYKDFDCEQLYRRVLERFADYPNVRVVRGVVPYSFEEAAPERIAFLHIDMNSRDAEILALERLFPKVSPGGIVVLDDFGWQVHRAQMEAETAFMQQRGYRVLELPTGQGLIFKRAE